MYNVNVQIHYSFWEEKYLGEDKDDNFRKNEDQLIRQINKYILFRAGSLNRDAGVDAIADSTDSKKTWIFKSFSRITPKKKSAKLNNTMSNF